jgi:hypothetical protein
LTEFWLSGRFCQAVTVTSNKNSIHAVFIRRSLLRKLHQKLSVFAWKQRHPWRKASAFLITVKKRGRAGCGAGKTFLEFPAGGDHGKKQ